MPFSTSIVPIEKTAKVIAGIHQPCQRRLALFQLGSWFNDPWLMCYFTQTSSIHFSHYSHNDDGQPSSFIAAVQSLERLCLEYKQPLFATCDTRQQGAPIINTHVFWLEYWTRCEKCGHCCLGGTNRPTNASFPFRGALVTECFMVTMLILPWLKFLAALWPAWKLPRDWFAFYPSAIEYKTKYETKGRGTW